MTRRKRVDANQTGIVEGLRKLGVFVEPRLSRIGDGVPDLLYCHRGVWGVAEVKMPHETLTEQEIRWWHRVDPLCDVDYLVRIWRSLDDARRDLGL